MRREKCSDWVRRHVAGLERGIVIDASTSVLSAGADPRVDAYAWAW